jgi:hypothetical protein
LSYDPFALAIADISDRCTAKSDQPLYLTQGRLNGSIETTLRVAVLKCERVAALKVITSPMLIYSHAIF